uniref:hypothetical protein n=1 Tax=Marinobacterium profundum TaxID=1714300 RepID=UPI00082AF189|nr:hypothetical protein [Marinobacterium profundum]
MLRWLFLLLLLANAVVLLWAALMQRESREPVPEVAEQGVSVRLLSEVDAGQLRVLGQAQSAAAQSLCVSYVGLPARADAEQVAQLMQGYGLVPVIEQEDIRLAAEFELALSVPQDPQERIALIERLQAVGVVPESSLEGTQLRLGRFGSEAEAEVAATRFRDTGLAPELKVLDRTQVLFSVLLPVDSDRDLFNKINRVLEKSHPGIKIEKKLCKGVATP